ncbi:S8 family serine peptidase [Niallia sp. MER TA 168]|uniref:S8 family serine peptidase n=1 Tax=Niallia sp. MER TA 168 TaxID=2939568 RepID=UPI00203EAC54|nr:S8 family serine peptidase [Niallia sp. MER TA 168]MCM3362733.1 S8 family serine peptidase [Niallia sp. MER TA 168]
MIKRTLGILLIFPLFISYTTLAASLKTPDLPSQNPNELQIAIVHTKTNYTEQEIDELLKEYPHLERRFIFKEVFHGFSVEGPVRELEKLKQSESVNQVSKVQTYMAEADDPVEIIGADEIRNFLGKSLEHLSGKGIKVGVIDTGIDYQHSDLQKNYKEGYDFVDKDQDPMETKGLGRRDTFHGTHVAGIIAADGKMKGVAPNATIYAYRALGPGGSGTTEQILAAIDRAVRDKVDIINLSLGSDVNGPDLPISLALNEVVKKGIIAVAAAGNAGPAEWTVGSPGTASKAISVGASTPNIYTPFILINDQKIPLTNMENSEEWADTGSVHLVSGGIGKRNQLTDVKGKLVLMERGELTFTEKVQNAYEMGAIGVLIYNNIEGPFQGMLEKEVAIPVAGITKAEGEFIKESIRKKETYLTIVKKWEKDILADFSSRGPVTSTWEIKPDVLAPGVVINSTVPNGYMSLQGTSMAAPFVAGACALLLEAHPDWGPEEVKASLMNTAKPVKNRQNVTYKVYEQGAGRIQVDKAIEANVLITPGSIRFGKYKLVKEQNQYKAYITVKNVGDNMEKISFDFPKGKRGISWRLPLSFTLKPGQKKNVPIIMNIDSNLFNEKLQDGIIKVRAGEQLIKLPYLYVLEEPDYPRIMGFDLLKKTGENSYEYETYLPTGAEEFGIALFREDTLQFIQFLDWKKEVKRGRLKGVFSVGDLDESGNYRIKVFAKKAGKEDMLEKMLKIK